MDEEQNYLHGTVRSNPLGCPLTNFGTGDSETLQIDSDTGTEIREDWYLSENIPYPSRRDNQKNREKASYQKEKIFQMFQDLRFDISFADALFFSAGDLLLRLGNLLMNKERGSELLGFPSDDFSTCNPTSTSEPFTLEEIDAFLYDKSISLESDHDYCDPEEDIYVLEQLLNDDPFQLPPMDLKQSEVTEANLH
ncbi:hypothetical protein Tco_0807973 [Tanacetum coccineum]